ncbi:MAG: SDR family oxidoreductase [Betaproteobacteria bacterium]|nr:SDR family oxidoreductase [Betaproteobacteria bacterium]
MTTRIAVVTGANRGIGFEICRQLAKQGVHVILTSRDEAKGQLAAARLRKEGATLNYHQLDVTDVESIRRFALHLEEDFDGIVDILVNNAGIMIDPKGSRALDSSVQIYRDTLETNVYGPLLMCQALVPMMRKRNYGRIVNLASRLGQLSDMGTGTPAYRVSKTALNVLTRMLAQELQGTNILVNSLCPGWVKTDMGGPGASRTVEEGADTAVFLATLPDGGPSGQFFRDRQPIPW